MKMAGPPDQGGAQRCQRVRLLDGKRDVGNMLTLMASGNNADDDDDNSRCWPAAHQATRSPDSCYLDLSISVPWQICTSGKYKNTAGKSTG